MSQFYFSNNYFILSLVFLLLSFISFQLQKTRLALVLLFFCSLISGIFIAALDPFINLWDEQFHALVAKNLLSHPLKLTLIEEPLFNTGSLHWSNSQIWLHKQPLFLWQIALSFKLFGANEFGLRLPSVLMHAIMIFFIFRTAEIFASKKIGYYSALLFTCAYFPLEYLTGFYPTDHNDISFYFYAFASLWALAEYYQTKKTSYILLIGVFSGAAILCKWLIGLLVYAVWFILAYTNRNQQPFLKEFSKLLLSFFVCAVLFLPWQIYSYLCYPKEYITEMAFNSRHISEPLEGHGGNYFFYYDALYEQFGEGFIIPPLILVCFVGFVFCLKNKDHKLILISSSVIFYTFFTFVQTKMYGYVLVIFPFFIMGLAYALNFMIDKITMKLTKKNIKEVIAATIILLSLFFLFNAGKIYKHHSNLEAGRYKSRLIDTREKQFFIALKQQAGAKKCLVFNCNTSFKSYILSIFYTGYPSFDFILNSGQIAQAKKSGYQLVAIDNGKLPAAVTDDNSITKIKFKVFEPQP